jgi:hypothetical protein
MNRIRLTEAAKAIGVSAGSLRKAHQDGRLVIWRVAGKDWTTMEEIDRMFERCPAPRKERVFGSGQPAQTAQQSGLSETADTSEALAAALMTAKKLKDGSRNTSRRSAEKSASTVVTLQQSR